MRRFQPQYLLLMLVLFAGLIGAGAFAIAQRGGAQPAIQRTGTGLASFSSEGELRAFLRTIQRRQRRANLGAGMNDSVAAPAPMEAPAAQSNARAEGEPGITNNQEAGVDEGGIVKARGDLLVMLRRGRLFTVSTAGGGMRAIDSINAFPPGVQAGNDWYDEMLIAGDRVIVVGYSYRRGGTEINRFRLAADGRLRFEDAWHLRSNDYYSSRNYASRLIGNRLVYYTPLYVGAHADPLDALPGVRRWDGNRGGAFRRIAGPNDIYIAPALRDDPEKVAALHSVVSCDLAAPTLDCSAIGVLGPASRTFYVSTGSVYLWITDWRRQPSIGPDSYVYRLPFGDEPPSAVAARGAPVDQFSFREDSADRVLNVLVRDNGRGDAMFRPEGSRGGVALLRLPLDDFGDGSREASASRYRILPSPAGENWSFHNRFVGDHVLYGGGRFGGGTKPSGHLVVAPVRGGPVAELALGHGVERIEVLGRDGLVVGGDGAGALGFSAIELAGRPRVANVYLHPAASEGETRSHAYFFSPDPRSPDGASGLLGLPIARAVEPAYRRFFGSAAAMLFLRRDDRRFVPAGELGAEVSGVTDDGCVASCVDWYGNARPIFMRRRIFALLGYELVEGAMDNGRIREIGRLNYAPPPRMARRGS